MRFAEAIFFIIFLFWQQIQSDTLDLPRTIHAHDTFSLGADRWILFQYWHEMVF